MTEKLLHNQEKNKASITEKLRTFTTTLFVALSLFGNTSCKNQNTSESTSATEGLYVSVNKLIHGKDGNKYILVFGNPYSIINEDGENYIIYSDGEKYLLNNIILSENGHEINIPVLENGGKFINLLDGKEFYGESFSMYNPGNGKAHTFKVVPDGRFEERE